MNKGSANNRDFHCPSGNCSLVKVIKRPLQSVLVNAIGQWSPTFWHQGLVSWKTIFPQTRGWGDGFRVIQAHYIYCALFPLLFPLLLHELQLRSPGIRAQRLGTPAKRCGCQVPREHRGGRLVNSQVTEILPALNLCLHHLHLSLWQCIF